MTKKLEAHKKRKKKNKTKKGEKESYLGTKGDIINFSGYER